MSKFMECVRSYYADVGKSSVYFMYVFICVPDLSSSILFHLSIFPCFYSQSLEFVFDFCVVDRHDSEHFFIPNYTVLNLDTFSQNSNIFSSRCPTTSTKTGTRFFCPTCVQTASCPTGIPLRGLN